MSLKKGDLVEVIGSVSYPEFIGKRYVLISPEEEVYSDIECVFYKGVFWNSPFKSVGGADVCFKEEHLQKVNPDGDELAGESFESLMSKLKSFKKDNNIGTVSVKLEEKVQ